MKKLLGILVLGLFWCGSTFANEIKIFYSGFSLSNTYESNAAYAKYTSSLIKEKNPETGINIISHELLNKVKKSEFDKIDLDTKNLLDFDKYPDSAIVMSVALQHEEFTQEFNQSNQSYMGFYDAYFQILFYDFSDKNLIASIPFDFEIHIFETNSITFIQFFTFNSSNLNFFIGGKAIKCFC